MKKVSIVLFVFLALSCHQSGKKHDSSIDPYHYSSTKRIVADHAAVASAHPLASEIGVSILKKGGNAIDAAIATQFALAVVYPEAGNIGGGGFTVIHLANGKNTTIDYREKAPGKASRDMYLDENGKVIPRASLDGALAAGVPGTVAGIFLTHEKYGKLPMKTLIQPAIDLAKNGFVITEREARNLNRYQDEFKAINTVKSAFVKKEWHAGDTLVQTDLAHTLELIRDKGKAGFYEGETASKIVAEMKRGNGMISLADLKNYQAVERKPIKFDYKGYTVVSMPPPSSGGVLLAQMLGMLSFYPIEEYNFLSVKSVQLMTEVERRAFADRATYLGDPDFIAMPLKTMMSKEYLRKRMADYDPDHATPSKEIHAGKILHESDQTTHLSVIDSAGNAVAITYTLNSYYGCKVVVGDAGFFLNNEMNDFSAKPGAPNKNGLVYGAEANAIAPNKRMLSSMSPTIVLKDEKPYLVLGTPGSATIITSVFQTIVDIIDFKMPVSDAVNGPKFHMQWMPDRIDVEKGFPDSTKKKLEQMGYAFSSKNSIGRMEVIKIAGDSIVAVSDSRGDDSAAGY